MGAFFTRLPTTRALEWLSLRFRHPSVYDGSFESLLRGVQRRWRNARDNKADAWCSTPRVREFSNGNASWVGEMNVEARCSLFSSDVTEAVKIFLGRASFSPWIKTPPTLLRVLEGCWLAWSVTAKWLGVEWEQEQVQLGDWTLWRS